jgi:hypothetical protein
VKRLEREPSPTFEGEDDPEDLPRRRHGRQHALSSRAHQPNIRVAKLAPFQEAGQAFASCMPKFHDGVILPSPN